MNKEKIYPFSLSFSVNQNNLARSNNSCYRYQQLSKNTKVDFPELYAEIGELHEVNHEKFLKDKCVKHEREVPFKIDLDDGVEVSGRCDFITDKMIHETKGSISSSVKSMLQKGEYKLEHLAQLCLYMSHFEKVKGKLVYGYYQYNKDGEIVCTLSKNYLVEIDKDGHIFVDKIMSGYSIANLIEFVTNLKQAKTSNTLAQEPVNNDVNDFKSPCRFCPLKDFCATKHTGETITKDDLQTCKHLIESKKVKEPKITKTRRKDI